MLNSFHSNVQMVCSNDFKLCFLNPRNMLGAHETGARCEHQGDDDGVQFIKGFSNGLQQMIPSCVF